MVFEMKEQIIKRRKAARYRFIALVRKAHLNSYWLTELDDLEIGDNVDQNIFIVLNRPQQERGVLTIHEKANLKKDPKQRTEEEVAHLAKMFDEIPCFTKITPILRKRLLNVVEFQYFGKDRLILKEGHPSFSMYFILNGEVLVTQKVFDKEQNTMVHKQANILSTGDFFGHVGLIYGIKRNASVTTKSDVELLCVHKEDFDDVLREEMVMKHENIKIALKRFKYFDVFSQDQITACCVISRINEFAPQQLIYSHSDTMNFSYFVLSGECMILQCLKIRKKSNGKVELVVPDPETLRRVSTPRFKREAGPASIIETGSRNIKHQFIDVATYSCGGAFGLGEDMENRFIIAKSAVQCLMIPRFWLFAKDQNVGNVWQRLKIFNDLSIPSQQKLFENYLANRKWKKYKAKVVKRMNVEHKLGEPETQIYSVPVVCRVEMKDDRKF